MGQIRPWPGMGSFAGGCPDGGAGVFSWGSAGGSAAEMGSFGGSGRVFVAPGVSGRHARRTFGPVTVGIIGIDPTLAESAWNAATSGKKRRVHNAAKCRRMRNGMKR